MNQPIRLSAILSLTLLAGAARASELDVTYCVRDGLELKADIHRRDDGRTYPALLLVHGGGFVEGSRLAMTAKARIFASAGFVVANIDYRLSRKGPGNYQVGAPFPAALEDARCAVRFLRANAGRYGLDPGRIGAYGESAGGGLAARLAMEGDVEAFVDVFGPTDFTVPAERWPAPRYARAVSEAYLGGQPTDSPELRSRAVEASPLYHVSSQAPPGLILHGSEDGVVPVSQSIAFHRRLREAGARAAIFVLPGLGHNAGAVLRAKGEEVVAFLNEALKGTLARAPAGR